MQILKSMAVKTRLTVLQKSPRLKRVNLQLNERLNLYVKLKNDFLKPTLKRNISNVSFH